MLASVSSRNKNHEFAMQIMYSFLIRLDLGMTIDFSDEIASIAGKKYEECDLFVKELLLAALKNESEIVTKCSSYLRNWKFSRLNTCVQAILILAIANYDYLKDSDKAVVIDVAVKLTKKYADSTDYKFVNGVLDNCLNDQDRG
jgi:N utilization substance protein B